MRKPRLRRVVIPLEERRVGEGWRSPEEDVRYWMMADRHFKFIFNNKLLLSDPGHFPEPHLP